MCSRNLLSFAIVLLLGMSYGCTPPTDAVSRIAVVENSFFSNEVEPDLLAENLNNPSSPLPLGDDMVFAESGSGQVSKLTIEGEIEPLITGFEMDEFGGYRISVLSITVDPRTDHWIISAAEGHGRISIFDPETFPTDAGQGQEIIIEGAFNDNPYATVLAGEGDILVASGGTSKAYQSPIDDLINPAALKPVFEIESGIIGITLDPISGDVFGAIFGSGPGDGSVVRWNPTEENISIETVASGFTNLVDVAFTLEGVLLALEFGGFDARGEGAVYVVATDGSGEFFPFITGLSNPSGIYVDENNTLYITEFNTPLNAQLGTLISVELIPVK